MVRGLAVALLLFGTTAVGWAQSPAGAARVVIVSDFVYGRWPSEQEKTFRDGLRELGRVEGQGLLIEKRHAASVQQRTEIAAELSRNPPNAVLLCPPCAFWARPSGAARLVA